MTHEVYLTMMAPRLAIIRPAEQLERELYMAQTIDGLPSDEFPKEINKGTTVKCQSTRGFLRDDGRMWEVKQDGPGITGTFEGWLPFLGVCDGPFGPGMQWVEKGWIYAVINEGEKSWLALSEDISLE